MSVAQSVQWQEVPATTYCDSVRDGTHDSPKFTDTGFPLVTSKNIKIGQIEFESANLISEADFADINRRSKVDQWDVLFSMIGTVGEVCLVQDEEPSFAIKNIGLFKCGDELKGRWLYYWFTNPTTKAALRQANRGASQQFIPLGALRALQIRVPTSRSAMRRIIRVLAAYDDLIENNRRRMALLEDSARLLYREWFVRLRFPGHEHTHIVDGVPQGWERAALEDALILQRGFDLPTQDRQDGTVPIYGSTGVLGHHNVAKASAPGVVTGRSGTLGEVQYVAEDYWPLNTALWVKEFKRVTPLFALFLLREMDLKQYNGGASVPTLDRKSVHRVEILIPPPLLLRSFDDFARDVFAQIKNLTAQNQKLREARDLLLPRLMSGEIKV